MNIKEELYKWRDAECARKGIESFRVLPNTTLDSIALRLPKNKDELCEIKGIKEMKFSQYGNDILKILNGEVLMLNNNREEVIVEKSDDTITVSEYLNNINSLISRIKSRIKGEVVTFQVSGNAVYFTIKDSKNDAVLSVFMWSSDYKVSNVQIESGLEVIVEGYSEIYKPSGKFSLRASTVELVGEGALKAAYDKLKNDLSREGLFDKDRKIAIKDFPNRIGVITSKQGAVIHDFLNNLGKFGYKITFVDSRVEGVLAIKDILTAIKTISKSNIDALVIIRGGGSLESLQAFNNEYVVRAISDLNIPVICAIGHDKDVPLAQLVADYSPSTPSMCTAILNESWNHAKFHLETNTSSLISSYTNALIVNENKINKTNTYLIRSFSNISNQIKYAINSMNIAASKLNQALYQNQKTIINIQNSFTVSFSKMNDLIKSNIDQISVMLDAYDPVRQLKLGYSLIKTSGKITRSVQELKIGDTISAQLSDGNITANITKIENI